MESSGDRARIGGILSIVAGAFGLLGALLLIFFIVFFRAIMDTQFLTDPSMTPEEVFNLLAAVYGVMGVFLALIGILGIVGGVFALKRQHWGLALAGAIAGTITFFPCGIAAVVFIALAKPEFHSPTASSVQSPVPPPAPPVQPPLPPPAA